MVSVGYGSLRAESRDEQSARGVLSAESAVSRQLQPLSSDDSE
jgi:hypothetical protein